MDIKQEIEKLVASITGDEAKTAAFQKDPLGTVKQLAGNLIPADQLDKVVAAVQAKLGVDSAAKGLSGLKDAVGGLLGKKE